jgi:hypothetical protein
MTVRLFLLATTLLALATSHAEAQSQTSGPAVDRLRTGAVVRYQRAGGVPWEYGRIAATTPASILIRPCAGCEADTVSRAALQRLELRRRGRSDPWILAGALLGSLAGAKATYDAVRCTPSRLCFSSPVIGLLVLGGASLGGAVGAVGGAAVPAVWWERLLPER